MRRMVGAGREDSRFLARPRRAGAHGRGRLGMTTGLGWRSMQIGEVDFVCALESQIPPGHSSSGHQISH